MLNISKKFSLLVGLFSLISFACAQPMEALKDELDRELMNYIASEKGLVPSFLCWLLRKHKKPLQNHCTQCYVFHKTDSVAAIA